jgi:hypothetical protein
MLIINANGKWHFESLVLAQGCDRLRSRRIPNAADMSEVPVRLVYGCFAVDRSLVAI